VPGDDPGSINAALEALMAREPEPVVTQLPRRAGQKELRYAHGLAGEAQYTVEDSPGLVPAGNTDRITVLEELTRELRNEVADLRAQLAAFRKQFE
jgi:uncharacterized protein YceH (UPF0502 family)